MSTRRRRQRRPPPPPAAASTATCGAHIHPAIDLSTTAIELPIDACTAPIEAPVDTVAALYNYKFVLEDRSKGVHNMTYAVQIMMDSLKALEKSFDDSKRP